MIKIFGATDTDFSSNGDIVIQPMKAKVHREDNGDYYLDFECDLKYLDYIVENNIAVAPTGGNPAYQAFRIHNVTVTEQKITSRCKHVFWDAKNYFIEYALGVIPYQGSIAQTMADYGEHTIPEQTLFVGSSDIISQYYYTLPVSNKTLFDAIGALRDEFSGHMTFDNWNYAINSSVGTDRGIVVRYGSNLKNITKSENWDDVVTKLMPIGKNGVKLNYVTPSRDKFITSSYYNQYDVKYVKSVAFSQDNVRRENYESEAAYKNALMLDLTNKGNQYINENQVPRITYEVKAIIDYPVDIGDTIVVIDERLGLDLTTHVISFDYDCLTERFENVQFGNFTNNAKGMGNTVKSLSVNAENAVIGGKQLQFNTDNTVSWANWG